MEAEMSGQKYLVCPVCEALLPEEEVLKQHIADTHPTVSVEKSDSFKEIRVEVEAEDSSSSDELIPPKKKAKVLSTDEEEWSSDEEELSEETEPEDDYQTKCQDCGEESGCAYAARQHWLRKHSGLKLHPCKECGLVFTERASLTFWHKVRICRQHQQADGCGCLNCLAGKRKADRSYYLKFGRRRPNMRDKK